MAPKSLLGKTDITQLPIKCKNDNKLNFNSTDSMSD